MEHTSVVKPRVNKLTANIKLCHELLLLKLFHLNIDNNNPAGRAGSYILPSKRSVYQLNPLKRLMRTIILHGPCSLVFMHPCPLMHLPLLLHLSPFLPVTQQVSDSQSLFNFLISSFPSHFSSTAWFISLSQSCCYFPPFLFPSKFSSASSPSSLASSGPPCLGLLRCTLLTFIHFICKWDIRDEEEGCREAVNPPASLFLPTSLVLLRYDRNTFFVIYWLFKKKKMKWN